jgi:hypothetical protein
MAGLKNNPATRAESEAAPPERKGAGKPLRAAQRVALCGFILYAIFAPHSIAGAEISLGLVGIGLAARLFITKRTGIRKSALDLPILLFLGWTILSAIFSAEPGISTRKLQSTLVVLLLYLTRAIVTGRTALLLAVVMIASGVAGVGQSIIDLVRGRGVMIEELSAESPFHELQLGAGDAVWRMNGRQVGSVAEIDEAIRRAPTGARLSVSIIKKGEHGERPGLLITDELKSRASPSGLKSFGPIHRFRASGWTRHYETFSETLQILAQLALGLALAHLQRGRAKPSPRYLYLALAAAALLVLGIALAAMRTTLVAFCIGAAILALRATRGRTRFVAVAAIALILALGVLAVWRVRQAGSLTFADHSASLRLEVARVGLSRIPLHPVFGHGMDAVKRHWTQWGFPGTDMIHLHSTPLQIAFERGLPALLLWLWLAASCWLLAARSEKRFREAEDANRHGLLLGATGSITGFFASSLVNYNFGDAEVALVFWWLMGCVVVLSTKGTGAQA